MSSGEFVGLVADNTDELIELKIFHSVIDMLPSKGKRKLSVIANSSNSNPKDISAIQQLPKQDVQDIVDLVLEVMNDPGKRGWWW